MSASLGRTTPRRMASGARLVALAIVVVVVDQATKAMAPWLASWALAAQVMAVTNAEFMLGVAAASQLVTVIVAAVMLVAFGAYTWRLAGAGRLSWWVPALLIGGAVSNLADRVVFGAVRDFLVTPWAIINLADVAVVIGLVAYIYSRVRCAVRARFSRGPVAAGTV